MVPFIPLYIKGDLQITNESDLAAAVAMFNFFGTLAYALFNPIWGKLSDRFGVKPMLLRGTFLTSILFPMMAYTSSVTVLIVLRFFSAACAGTTAASQTMLVRTAPENRQGFALGVLTTAIWGGGMLGNVIGGLVIHYFNYTYAFWLCGILYFVAGFSILFTKDDSVLLKPAVQAKKTFHMEKVVPWLPEFTRSVWLLMVLFVVLGLVRNFEAPYVALKIEELTDKANAAKWTGIVSAIVCCGAIVAGVISGYLVDKLPPNRILLPIIVISAAALALQGYAKSLWLFAIARTALYLAAGGLQPLLQKVLSQVTPKRKRGSIFGFASSAQCCGNMLAALLGGYAFIITKLSGVFYIGALLILLALPLMQNFITLAINRPRFPRRKRRAAKAH